MSEAVRSAIGGKQSEDSGQSDWRETIFRKTAGSAIDGSQCSVRKYAVRLVGDKSGDAIGEKK